MQVVLAYPYSDDKGSDHKPDTKVSVTDEEGARLLREGLARTVEADNDDVRAPKKSAAVDTEKKG